MGWASSPVASDEDEKVIAIKHTVNISAANELHLLEPFLNTHKYINTSYFHLHPSCLSLICSSIAQQHVHLAIRVFVCLSMSILLKRDMSSPRKLLQARNSTSALAYNHG